MLAGYGDFGALQRISYNTPTTNSIWLANIPQTFQDLMIVMSARDTGSLSVTNFSLGLNYEYGTGTNFSITRLRGDGASATSTRGSNLSYMSEVGYLPSANNTSGIFNAATIHILNYANTSTNKTVLIRSAADANGSGIVSLTCGLWRSTAAITSVGIALPTLFAAGSTVALYGIKASAA